MTSLFTDDHGGMRPGWMALLFILAVPFVTFLCSLPFALFVDLRGHLLLSKTLELGVALGLTFLFLKGEGHPLAAVGLALDRRWCRELGLGAAWGAGLQLAAAAVAWGTGAVRWEMAAVQPGAILWAFGLFAVVAFHEELLFRGYPFQRLVESWGFWPAQLVLGLLFAAIHLGNPHQEGVIRFWSTANIALAGLLFGVMWRATGSLALAIGAHFAWNFTQGPILGFGVSGNALPSFLKAVPVEGKALWLHGGAFGLEATLACALVCFAAIVWFARRQFGSVDSEAGA